MSTPLTDALEYDTGLATPDTDMVVQSRHYRELEIKLIATQGDLSESLALSLRSLVANETLREAVERLNGLLTAGPDKVLRCAFCGEAYPDGTPMHKHDALIEHIRVCTVHPLGIENRDLRDQLAAIFKEAQRL